MVFPQSDIIEISEFAHGNNILLHLDGARLWDVAAQGHLSMSELCAPADSVSLCFSKGLGAPIGTCLVGSASFIQKARWFRKSFGGGMRQTGIIAAAAAYALTHNFSQLPRVHALAKRLQSGLQDLGVRILCPAETCMVGRSLEHCCSSSSGLEIFYDPSSIGLQYQEILDRAAVLPNPIALMGSRLVVHIQTSEEAVNDLLTLIRTLKDEKVNSRSMPFPGGVLSKRTGTIYVQEEAIPAAQDRRSVAREQSLKVSSRL